MIFSNMKTSLTFITCLFLGSVQFASAQAPTVMPLIEAIEIEFDGFKSVSDGYVMGHLQLREGMPYSSVLADQSIRSLYATNRFEFVEVKVEEADEGSVKVLLELVPKYTIGSIAFDGSDRYSNDRLIEESEISIGIPLDEYSVAAAARKIQEYYVKKGFPESSVDYRTIKDSETGFANVIFDIVESRRLTIKSIDFEGNVSIEGKQLRNALKTKNHNWLSWLTGSGKFLEAEFAEDLQTLRQEYQNLGYLDVVIDPDAVRFEYPKNKKMRIVITIEEGQQYSLGKFIVEGMTIFTSEELLRSVRLESGDPFSPGGVDAAASALREYYTSRGYLEAYARAERQSNMETRAIDVVFKINESEKYYVESIKVEGNTKTKTRVIIRELALRPSDVFDLTRMKTSEQRLQNTRFFGDVRLSPEVTDIPGRRDLSVNVEETHTGNLSFGVGFGSVESAKVFFETKQGNFDIFNPANGFQGDGQKFRLRFSIGSQSNQALLTFEEPWLFEQRLAFGVELFRTESDYQSSDYNELRTGFELYLRRRLFELVEGRLSYRLEFVDIFDVAGNGVDPNDNVADVFQAGEGESVVSKVGLTLLRDSRDTVLFTRKGNRTTLEAELAGLGGDINYLKIEGRTAQFLPTFDYLEQTFTVLGRLGSTLPYGDSETVPFYDRFYLGGPDTLRGFDYRDVGPRDNDDPDEPIGGNTYGLLSLEYSFRLAEPFALVAFYDMGFVNKDKFDFNLSDFASNWGIGARVMLMGSPLKLDLGFPINDPAGDASGTQFNFSFGTRF
jgi:outer membrane protein insertion porin family